jgi:hypothetical protein
VHRIIVTRLTILQGEKRAKRSFPENRSKHLSQMALQTMTLKTTQ